ncbi:MAG: (2Fe-2S) ferredoxin domain-containing protein [Pseudanabaenaceae cyanobacterium]|jgi:(2Fe-2S) ferredoxin
MQTVMVCQFRTCKHDGAEALLNALQEATKDRDDVAIGISGCMGLCGSGPMLYLAPDHLYYWRMDAHKVAHFVEQQLDQHQPINEWLHPRLHQFRNS